jgi:hypothetical protein
MMTREIIVAFDELAGEAGWSVSNSWMSDAPQVALFRLEPKQVAAAHF